MSDSATCPPFPQMLKDRPLLHDHPAAWRLSRLLWLLSAFLFVALTIPTLRNMIDTIDEAFHDMSISAECGPLVATSKALDIIGSVWVIFPFIGLIAIWFASKRNWEALGFR